MASKVVITGVGLVTPLGRSLREVLHRVRQKEVAASAPPFDTGAFSCPLCAPVVDFDAQQVDCVNAHGTGTPKNDIVETAAIKQCLGRRAHEIPVHAVKSMTGHMVAASGAVEAVAAVLTIWRRTVPPTINLECPDQECDLDYVGDGPRPFLGSIVLSNSFGFGGQNATVLFARCA